MKRGAKWLFVLFFISLTAVQVPAQVRGVIKGKVKDEQGNPIKDVIVRVENEKGRSYKLKTNKKGEFFHGGIPSGSSYVLFFEKETYQPTNEGNVRPGRPGFSVGAGLADQGGRGARKGPRGVVNVTLKKAGVVTRIVQVGMDDGTASIHTKGLEAYGAGQYREAATLFRQVSQKAPKQYYVWANLGRACVKTKQYDQAIEAYEKAIALKPENPSLYASLGGTYATMGDTEKAVETFERAAGMSTGRAYYNMGITFINLGKNDRYEH